MKVTLTDLLLTMFAQALKSNPELNATWDGRNVSSRSSVDLGLAVATLKGVIAPVIRNLGYLDLRGLVARRTELVDKAQAGPALPGGSRGWGSDVEQLGHVPG